MKHSIGIIATIPNVVYSLHAPESGNRNGFGVCLVVRSIFYSDEQLYFVYAGVWFAKCANICSFIVTIQPKRLPVPIPLWRMRSRGLNPFPIPPLRGVGGM